MKYLEACLKECHRLCPPVPMISRVMNEDVLVPLGHTERQVVIPKYVNIIIDIFLIHRNEDHWPDPERYDPQRFLGATKNFFSFIPFSAGPRNCLGSRYAMIKEKTILSTIFRRFSIKSLTKVEEIRAVPHVTYIPYDKVNVKVEERK